MRISMDSTSELPDLNGRDDQESTITPESPTAKELLSRTTLETHKLDMMAEISQLKLKLATSDKRGKEMDRKLMDSQKRIDELQIRLNDRTLEVTELRLKTPRNGTIPNNNSDTCGDLYRDRTLEREKTLDRLKRKHSEVDRLKKAVESLVAANDEKERHIDDLRKTMQKYKRLEEVILSSQGRKVLETLGFDDERSDTSSNPLSSASSQDTHPLRDYMQPLHHSRDSLDDYSRRTNSQMPAPSATSTPVSGYNDPKPLHTMGQHEHPYQAGSNLYATTPPSLINMDTPRRPVASKSLQRSNSAEDINSRQKTPSTVRKRADGYVGSEAEDEALKDSMAQEYKALASTGGVPDSRPTQPPGATKKTSKGFRRFFNRLKRSNSQDLDPDELEDFKRSSALRSTAGPRLGWSRDTRHTELEVPFSRWDADRVTTWLHHLGFTTYGKECRRWIKNGQQLLKASSAELEKDFGMKNYFHRKKLMLHVQAKGSEQTSTMDDLDHNWVTRWLDDVGLPQYKTEFSQALIDGRVLNYLTVDDLRVLTVVNTLHLLSFKRAIQVLRQNDFNPIVLKRRPSNDESHHQCGPHEVMLWTNHRVMEWLRTIDLSEYAPNLRGSGVHGALMVLEPRFGAEIFATLLSIPSTKTLLRRHLSTHFIRLIGQEMQHYKREQEATPGFMPLTPNQKIKTRKFNLFNSHRRARSENEVDDYVCPMDNLGPLPAVHTNGNATKIQLTTSNVPSGTPYASDVTAMTHMLNKDPFMDNVPTSNV